MTTAALFVMLFAFMFLGMPVAVALGLSSLLTILVFGQDSLASLALKLYETSEHFTLLSIPFFILGGAFMTTGGVARRMIRFAVACVGHLRGGLAMASVLACMLFAAVSGSSPATVVAVGSIVIAGMVRAGYPQSFAAGVVCNAGTLGILIPPSIVMVVYGASTETSVGKLFMAGVVPGIMLGLLLMVAIYALASVRDLPRQPRASLREVLVAGRDSLWGLLLIVIILGGIYGGVFTPTEASAVAVFYALVVGLLIYREIKLADLAIILRKSVLSSAVIMFIIANAGLFAFLITRAGVPDAIGHWLEDVLKTPAYFLLGVNAALFLIGMFIETSAAIIVLAPILAPVAMHFGIDPVHFGLIMVVNLALGMITPPFGVNLFAACTVARISLDRMIKDLIPFVLVILACLMVITYVPGLSLGLRDLVYAR